MKSFIESFSIPFYQTKIEDWEFKQEKLLSIYEDYARDNMSFSEQNSDFDNENNYHVMIETILFEDIKRAVKEIDWIGGRPRVGNAWFQTYDHQHTHAVHNHGLGHLSMVCYIKYNPEKHRPTTFVCPYTSLIDGNVMEWEPEDVEEGTLIMWPSGLAHYAPANLSDERRMILSANIK